LRGVSIFGRGVTVSTFFSGVGMVFLIISFGASVGF
jgi:hypothetical protein